MLYPSTPNRSASVTLVEGKLRTRIPLQDILFVQSEHVYVRIFLTDGRKILYRCSLREFIRKLPAQSFLQIHRCYIANLRWISEFNRTNVVLAGQVLPVSRTHRKILRQALRAPRHLTVQNRNTPLQYKVG